MIDLIILWCLGRATYETAREKGRSGGIWILLLIVTWLAAEVLGALLVNAGWVLFLGSLPHILVTYAAAVVCGVVASIWLGKFLDGRASLVPPPLPLPPRQPIVIPPDSRRRPTLKPVHSSLRKFKFPCPHCGQRISATGKDSGTEAYCPTCRQPFIVGSENVTAAETEQIPAEKFKFSCPHCSQRISSTTDVTGTSASCPSCDQEFIVESAARVPAESSQSPPEKFKFACPHCEQRISSTTDVIGTEARCPTCSSLFTVGAENNPGTFYTGGSPAL